jgi:hypothetical protein
LSSCDDTTTGAEPSRTVISKVSMARCRWARLTIRCDLTRTRLPAGVRHRRSRVRVPSRKSSTRSYASRSATDRSNGSSSMYSFISLASGTLTIVWPVLANPNASSAWWMCQVSWNALRKVPWLWASRPSSGFARIPM